MKLGIDVFMEKHVQHIKGKRVGLVTNLSSVNKKLIPSIELLFEHPDIQLTALYTPEHGLKANVNEGEKVGFSIDEHTHLPVYSLYGETKRPSTDMLGDVDAIVIDLQDIGSRYYTFIYTMAYVMEACKDYEKECIILDRPNPISGRRKEGNLVEEKYRSFVGLYPIPNRHGLTIGEIAMIYKYEFGIDCNLTVVPLEGWQRSMYFDETGLFWAPPTPNSTGLDMCMLYPGTCLIEGTNLSEGRGTTKPFEIIGAPFINGYKLAKELNAASLPGVIARPISFIPAANKFKGKSCSGIQLHITDRHEFMPLLTGITLLSTVAEMYTNEFEFLNNGNQYFFDFLAGTDKIRKQIVTGNIERIYTEIKKDVEFFERKCQDYYMY